MGNWDYWKKKDRSFYKDVFVKRANEDLPTMESQKACMKIMYEKFKIANPKILDIGCGSGYFLNTLPEIYNSFSYKGVDFNKEYLDIAKKIYLNSEVSNKIEFEHADAQDLPFDDNQFEIVFSVNTFPHIPNVKKAIQEAIRVSSKYVLIRMLVADEVTIVKKSLNNELDENGNPLDYMLVNTYSLEFLKEVVGDTAKIELIDDTFDAENLQKHFKNHSDVTGKHIATSVLGNYQIKGIILMNWKFLLLKKNND